MGEQHSSSYEQVSVVACFFLPCLTPHVGACSVKQNKTVFL